MRNWQEGRNFGFEQPNEFCVHVFVFVWYVEADDSLVREVLPELGSDFVSVRLLHDEDDLCPLNQLWRQWIVCIMIRPRRGTFDSRMACEYLLSRWATQAILATDEEDALHVPKVTSVAEKVGPILLLNLFATA
jgi:hypothetical protein